MGEENLSTPYARAILMGLLRKGKHVYTGTVTKEVKSKRRAKNKVAANSRRTNRIVRKGQR